MFRAQDTPLLDFINGVQRGHTGADLSATADFDVSAGLPEGEVRLRDVPWDILYAPVARVVGFVAERLNTLQFLTIRGYLTLVFGALVALLIVLAVWQ